MSQPRIAFIGLGNMGIPMARNLVAAGYAVTVWNRTPLADADLAQHGFASAATPAQAAAQSDGIVITMVADDAALDAVTLGEQGLLAGLPQGGLHISMSTVSVQIAQMMARAHVEAGCRYLAAPVFGRPEAAAAAKLSIVAAGDAADVAQAEPLFKALGQAHFHVGPNPEQANTVKLAGNFLLMAMLEALGEAFALTAKAGVPARQVLDIVNGALMRSPVYENYGNIAINERFDPPGFKLRLGLKDANLVLAAANASGVPMPTASLVHDRILGGVARGAGELDWSVITRLVAEDAGLGR
ncbi:NAD(P)-dependent oxidoreductase [uncultured Nevskia sp.]|uniref:NAD(P)-dependent oxidoreductase n=1 Tax=uncultured Nevskia sp. TaxID=228950 RepID=UPI0025F6793F|nr:NAD(P)-dependent oxidoreductase [uncultured Nevskia sp.]